MLTVTPDAPAAVDTTVVVHADQPLGPSGDGLRGVSWNAGSLDGVAPLAPPHVRIDASLESASKGPDDLDLSAVQARAAAVRAIGAEPMVILSYMPPWLARNDPRDPRDDTKVAPADFDQWEELVRDVVRRLASAPAPVHRFEVWNEPDLPIFWQDSPADFFELAVRTHRAVRDVTAELGQPLEIGGPATFAADPAFMLGYFAALRAAGLSADFVSWHHYGNTPLLGPDGDEGLAPPPFDQVTAAMGHRNPATTPSVYGAQVEAVRSWVGDPAVPLVISEWNLSAGGYDLRHDTHEGAAFAAATLTEMERAGLDRADFYRAASSRAEGDWGLVWPDGRRKPTWWVQWAWSKTAGERLAVTGDAPAGGLWARATWRARRIDVLLSSFVASGGAARSVRLDVGGACVGPGKLRRLGAGSPRFSSAQRVAAGEVVDVPAQSVTWVRFATC